MKLPIRVLSTKFCADETIQKAERAGIKLIQKPLITIHHTAHEPTWLDIMKAFKQTHHTAVFVFTSSNAVRALNHTMTTHNFDWPAHAEISCMEGKTANLVKSLWNAKILCTAKDADSLCDEMMRIIPLKRALFFCSGSLRGDLLPDKMQDAGYTLKEWKVYETRIEPEKLAETYDAYLFFSPSGVISFLFANDWPVNAVAVAIGSTTESALKSSGIAPVLVASSPNEESLIDELIYYFTNEHT